MGRKWVSYWIICCMTSCLNASIASFAGEVHSSWQWFFVTPCVICSEDSYIAVKNFACSQPVSQSPLRHIIEYPPAGTHSHLVAIVISLPSSSPCRGWNLPRNKTCTSSPGWYHSASNNYRLVQRQHLTLLQSSKEGQLHKETAPFEELLLYLLDKAWLHSVYEILSAVPISQFPHCSWWLDQNILHRGWLCIKSRPIVFKEMCGSVIVNP